MIDQIVPVHADAVVGNRQGVFLLVRGNRDFQFAVAFGGVGLGQLKIFQFVAGIARV